MPETSPQLDLTSRTTFKHWAHVPIRYTDQDTLGHVNNVAYGVFLEQARCELIYPMIERAGFEKAKTDIVVARVAIDYLTELTYPGVVEVGTVVTRIGTKSFHLAHGLFKRGSDVCVAKSDGVMVWYDLNTRQSFAATPELKAELMEIAA